MYKRTTRVLLSFIGLITLLSLLFYYEPIDRLQRIRRKYEYNQAALDGAMLGSGFPPVEYGIGIGHFTLEKLDHLKLRVPRAYINYKPNEPNGKTDMLLLSFFLPNMQPRHIMEKQYSNMSQQEMWALLHALHVHASISAKDKYIKCWGGQCLGPEFGMFQSRTSTFQEYENHNEGVHALQNGQYDASLDLTAYKSLKKCLVYSGEVDVDTIYLKPNADPSNPKEWIHCSGHGCHQYWFRDGLYIKTTFDRAQLAIHASIRKKVDQKVDAFIQKPTTQ